MYFVCKDNMKNQILQVFIKLLTIHHQALQLILHYL